MVATAITGNGTITVNAGDTAVWKAPSNTTWFFLQSLNFGPLQIAFDQEALIPFPRRSMRKGKFSQIRFYNPLMNGTVLYGSFIYGTGEPPIYPDDQNGNIKLAFETLANSLVLAGNSLLIAGVGSLWVASAPMNVVALYISCPASAPNSLWLNTSAAGTAGGIEIHPGETRRVPYTGSNGGGMILQNPGAANIQAGIGYEVVT